MMNYLYPGEIGHQNLIEEPTTLQQIWRDITRAKSDEFYLKDYSYQLILCHEYTEIQ